MRCCNGALTMIDYGMEPERFDRPLDVILKVLPSDHLGGAPRGRVGNPS
jgi:hypothetical protein